MLNTLKNPKINSSRQLELDVAKGIAILSMVAVHVLDNLAFKNLSDTGFGGIIAFFGTLPAAPVFMFLLGTGMVYSKSDTASHVKRGLQVFALGYLLNFIRTGIGAIPLLMRVNSPLNPNLLLEGFFNIDILQFAGLSLIYLGFIKKTKQPVAIMTCLGLGISLLNFPLLAIQTANPILSAVTGLLWGSSPWSAFPFATWVFYPTAGYLFGAFLIVQTNKAKFYNRLGLASAFALVLLSAVAAVFSLDTGLMTDLSYYHHTLFSNTLYTAFVLLWVSLLYYTLPTVPEAIKITLKRWSSRVNSIYFIHWIGISTTVAALGSHSLNGFSATAAFLTILILSDYLAGRLKRKNGVSLRSIR